MSRRKRAWNWAVAVALVIFGGASVASAQSSTQGGGLSTKAILALEACFDEFQNFTCGAPAGSNAVSVLTPPGGTVGRTTRWTTANMIGDGSMLDDGTNVTLEDDVKFIIGETATTGSVGGITWNTFAGGGVERLDIDGTGNAGVLITHGIIDSGAFIVADGTGSFIHTFSQQAPKSTGNSGPAWIMFVDNPTQMNLAANQRIGLTLEMESNAADVAGAQQIGFQLENTGATSATQDAFLFEAGTGWDNDIVKGTETVRTALNFAAPSGSNTITIPAATGTMALTSDITSPFPLLANTVIAEEGVELRFGIGFDDSRIVGAEFDLEMLSVDDAPGRGGGRVRVNTRFENENGPSTEVLYDQPTMNGGDSQIVLQVEVNDPQNHTGAGNTLTMIDIPNLSANANTDTIGIAVGTGFDDFITVDEGVDVAFFTVPALTADRTYTFPDLTGTVAMTSNITTAVNAAVSGTTDTMSKFTGTNVVGDSDLFNAGVSGVGLSSDVIDLTVSANILNGSDTFNGFVIDIANADHTGSSNAVTAIQIDSITNDLQAVNTAINIGTAWTNTIKANNITMNTLGGTFKVVNTTADVLALDASVSGGMLFQLEHNGFGVARGKIEFEQAFTASNGSDNLSFLQIDGFTDPNHTGVSNTTNVINVGDITSPDADSQHNVFRIGDGWEFLVNGIDALGSDWTTALDKSANTAAGTIRVEIGGTLYHIQLFADS